MIPRRPPRPAMLAWLAMFAAIATGSLLPAGDLPPPAFDGIDKLEHLAGYGLLSGWSVLLFERRDARLRAMLAAIAFGVAVEIAQGVLTATREPDVLDAVANSIGALLGQLLAFTPLAGRLRARA
ncbi:MAG TPA: VanZ family protein [Lysobacter sp.]